jgi:hypothetical protein
MKVLNLSSLVNIAFNYVIYNTKKFNIDESHALKHSMEVFNFANNIFNSELKKNPYLEEQQDIISVSAFISLLTYLIALIHTIIANKPN